MADRWTKDTRSRLMSRVKNKNTRPELLVRSLLHRIGYRFRLHRRDLPGSPDIVLPKHRKAIFVHGCFWHGHDCPKGKRPKTNREFWEAKLDLNIDRDRQNLEDLKRNGWEALTVWECELKDLEVAQIKLHRFMTRHISW